MKPVNRLKFSLNFAALLFFFCGGVFAEEHFNIAARHVFNSSWWAHAYRQSGLMPRQSIQLQSLNRVIYSGKNNDCRFRFEAELATDYKSHKGIDSERNWQTGHKKTGFKVFKTHGFIFERSNTRMFSEIERLDFSFSLKQFDIQIGRQPIGFGTSHFVSAMDILAPFQPGYLDSSYRPGIDAVRIRTIHGQTGEIELILVAGEDAADNTALSRMRDTRLGFDLELVAGLFRRRSFFAFGWEGERKQVNFWGEIAAFSRKNADRNFGGISPDIAFSWIIGIEKDTGNDWRHGLALFNQDFGYRRSDDIAEVYATLPLRQNWVHLSGSRYLIANSAKKINALTHFNFNLMFNVIDRSMLLQPVLNLNLSDESDVSLFAIFNNGSKPEPARIKSEFASFPAGLGFIYRRFF